MQARWKKLDPSSPAALNAMSAARRTPDHCLPGKLCLNLSNRANVHSDQQAGRAPQRHLHVALFACLLLMCGSLGCSRLRLPAIDPNGSRLFLPFPNTTQLNVPRLHATENSSGLIPNPAFTQPTAPPPCLDGGGGVHNLYQEKHRLFGCLQDQFKSRGEAGEIQLTPRKVLAPVGGEVVLLAGICGPDGYLVKREPLEWMLSPDSVGTFIEVGDDRPGKLSSFLLGDSKIEKLDVDFARGRTSSKASILTLGSPTYADDIRIREGQTWLSISSPSEGVSRVTVLAPESEIWDRRKLTTTIYWVDAQWEFPAPQIRLAGEPIQLVTRVTKAENLVPAEGWIVDYTILDPTIATFGPSFEGNKARVRVNADGQAIVNLSSLPNSRGTTPVIIDVIRPAQPSDNLPQLVMGRGQTTATFSAPGLELEVFGPGVGNVGQQLTYTATLGNPGDLPTENAELRVNRPAGTKLVGATPQPSTVTNDFLLWEQGTLPANQQLDVSVTFEAQQENTIGVLFEGQAANFQRLQRRVVTQIVQPTIDVRFEPSGGIAEAEVGQTVQYEIDVVNTGRQTLTNLVLEIATDPGLPELYQQENNVEQQIDRLGVGETQKLGVTFRVQQTGQLGARLVVKSGEQILAERSSSIRGVPPPPKQPQIGVSIQFPERIVTRGRNTAVITLRNSGETELTNIQVDIQIPPSLEARQTSETSRPKISLSADGRLLTWRVDGLAQRSEINAGDVVAILRVEFESLRDVQGAQIQVQAAAAENVQAQDAVAFNSATINSPSPVVPPNQVNPPPEINPPGSGGGEVNPPNSVNPPPAQPTGRIRVELMDFDDPTIVGRQLRYNLVIANETGIAQRNVQIRLQIPNGVSLQSISRNGNPVSYQFVQNGILALPDIQFIRANETNEIAYLIVVRPDVPQLMELQAAVSSDEQPQPSEAIEKTSVYLNPR